VLPAGGQVSADGGGRSARRRLLREKPPNCCSQSTIGRNQGFLKEAEHQELYDAADKQARMLAGLRKSLGV